MPAAEDGVSWDSGEITAQPHPVITPPFPDLRAGQAERLEAIGRFPFFLGSAHIWIAKYFLQITPDAEHQ